MVVDETAALAEVLKAYQQESAGDSAEARLAIALMRVVEQRVRPSLQKRLKPQDVDDICSEVILGFWKFRFSVRPDEVRKLIHTLVERKRADLLRGIYKEAEYAAPERSADELDVLELLPDTREGPAGEASQKVWELLYEVGLSAQDHLVAYTLHLGVDKQVVGKLLGISGSAITRSIERCRKALAGRRAMERQSWSDG